MGQLFSNEQHVDAQPDNVVPASMGAESDWITSLPIADLVANSLLADKPAEMQLPEALLSTTTTRESILRTLRTGVSDEDGPAPLLLEGIATAVWASLRDLCAQRLRAVMASPAESEVATIFAQTVATALLAKGLGNKREGRELDALTHASGAEATMLAMLDEARTRAGDVDEPQASNEVGLPGTDSAEDLTTEQDAAPTPDAVDAPSGSHAAAPDTAAAIKEADPAASAGGRRAPCVRVRAVAAAQASARRAAVQTRQLIELLRPCGLLQVVATRGGI